MGPELMMTMISQAERFGAKLLYKNVTKVEFDTTTPEDKLPVHKVFVGNEEFRAHAVVIATGAKPRKLGVPGEEEFWGRGVSSCATCDGAFYRGKKVAVVGGGDSAMEEADFLTKFADKVYVVHRRDELRASKIMQKRAQSNPKIEFILNTNVVEVVGGEAESGANSLLKTSTDSTGTVAAVTMTLPQRAQGKVRAMRLVNNATKEETEVAIDGFFLGIGYIPETEMFGQYIDVNQDGYARPVNRTMSKVNGVFIAGDVEDDHYRQAVTAAADGCKAALDAERWLAERV